MAMQMFLIFCLCVPLLSASTAEASSPSTSWTHCGYVDLPEGGTSVTTDSPWLHLSPGNHGSLYLHCSCLCQPDNWTVSLLVTTPRSSYHVTFTMVPPCSVVGCQWNPTTYLIVPRGGVLERGGGVFEHAHPGLVRVHGDVLNHARRWVNITMPAESTANLRPTGLIILTQSLPFDVWSCVRSANSVSAAPLFLSLRPLSHLASHTNRIHELGVVTDLTSPSSTSMNRRGLRAVRQASNTPPRFTSLFYKEEVDENNEPGVTVGRVHADDPDSGIEGQVTYSLVASDDVSVLSLFEINEESGDISVNEMLDHEVGSQYTFRVLATDGANETGITQFRLEVVDLNDNHPTFQQGLYHNHSIREDTQVGTEVVELVVVDEDSGSNGQVTYSLLDNPDHTFSVVQSGSGASLTLREGLDYETRTSYLLTILAHDGGIPSLSSSATVEIRVTDVADTLPVFNATSYTVSLLENTSTIEYLLTVRAVSSDSAPLALLEYFIVQGDLDGRFSLDQSTGVLSLVQPLDYERAQAHLLQVQAQSVVNPTLRSTANVHITVGNVNDHAPSFSRNQYSVSVLESVSAPAQVVTVTAEDLDLGEYGEVSYALHPDTEADVLATFDVDSRTGSISTRTNLDKEGRDLYRFTVEASDRGNPPLVSGVMVVIHVTDVNDERPVFSQSVYTASIQENKAPGSEVATVNATDSDSDTISLQYVIQSGNYGNAFLIEASNGMITNRIHLDREQRSEYTLVVVASDQQFDSLPVLVHINVTDENDERPVFSASLYTPPPVPETTPTGTELLRVHAMDRDVGSNGVISYTSPDIDPVFQLHASSGAITIVRNLDYESSTIMYSFTVQATDGGNPSMSSSARVIVSVMDENDNPPIFEGSQFSVTVSENQPPHTSVIQLSASDADSGSNSDLSYSVVGDMDALRAFGVYQSGLVYTLEVLDRERQDHYQVVVHVSDRGVEPLSDDVTISVAVDDVIDYPPFFSQLVYTVLITMETLMNFELLTVSAMTLDLQSSLIYDITSGDRNLFSIDQNFGVITTATTLDPVQDAGEYTLQVTAQHSEFAGTAVVIVTVQVDDGVPVLEPLTVYFSVYESHLSDRNYIGRVLVQQPQGGVAHSFSLVDSDPGVRRYFDISETDGDLIILGGVATGVYSINVTVTTPTGTGYGGVTAYVRVITNATLNNAVLARFASLREASFVSLHLELFTSFVTESIATSRDQVEIVGVVSESHDKVQLAFAVRDPTSLGYLDQETVVDRLSSNGHNARPSSLVGYELDECLDEPCPNLQLCEPTVTMTTYRPGAAYRSLQLGQIIFISQPFSLEHTCHCRHGYSRDDLCSSEVDLCDPSPCHLGGMCEDHIVDYHCVCPQGVYGRNCSIICPSLSCDPCGHAPCLYDGVCTTDQDPAQYICDNCPWGSEFSGPNCELTTLNFKLGSFVTFDTPPFSASLKLSLQFVTVSPNGLLLYSGRVSGCHDYISIELVIGQVRVGVSYGGSVTVVRTESPWQLNDAEWHSVVVELRERELRVHVSGCGQGPLQGVEYSCDLSATLYGAMRTLDLTSPLYVGGLESHVQRHQAISSTSYTGCIGRLVVGGTLMDLNAPLRSQGVEIGCPPRSDKCISDYCFSGSGRCVSVWNGTVCSCEGESPLCDSADTDTSVQLFPGYLRLSLTAPTSLDHFSVALRTRSSNAVLARLGAGTVELVQGSVQFRRPQGTMLTALTLVADAYVNDGLWHEVTLTHSHTHTQLAVDGGRVVVRSPEGGALPVQTITLGAEAPAVTSSRFIGCLRQLEINILHVDLRAALTSSMLGYEVTYEGVASGCGTGGPCVDVECPAHSSCVGGWRNYSCECDTDNSYRVVGGACVNPCDPTPCLNEGVCSVSPLTNFAPFHCTCVGGYSGVKCEGVSSGACETGFYGPPLQCQRCKCDPGGVVEGVCDGVRGSCLCKDGDYYSRAGDLGCKSCDCHVTGSTSSQCDPMTGQCVCRPHVIGWQCDRCASGYAGMDEEGCKEAELRFGSFSLAQTYSSYYDNSLSPVYLDLTGSVSEALERELMTFGLSGHFEASITRVSNSSGSVGVEYQIASYFTGDHTHLSLPSVNTVGSVMQVIVQSGWAGPHRLLRNSHSLSESCDLYPALCGRCPEGTTKDGIICRAVGVCEGVDRDRDGIPDSCDNCTFTFNPDQDSAPCEATEGVCPGGVVSGVLWSPTPGGSNNVKLCPPPSTGYATRPCGVGGVWGGVDLLGCLSPTGQLQLELAMSLAGGQLLSLDELKSLLTQLTAHTTAHPLSSSDVQAAGRLLSQLIPVVPAYSSEQVSNLIKNCSRVASNLLVGDSPSPAPWQIPAKEVGYTSEDYLRTIEQLFTIAGQLDLSLSEEHLVVSPYRGESPTDVVIGDKRMSVHVPDQLTTPIITLGGVAHLGQWLPARFTFNTDTLNLTVATPLLVVQGSEVNDLTMPINMTLPYHSPLVRPEGTEFARCVFWEYKRGWSTNGCGLVSHNSTHTTCTCSHLTAFAVLLPESSFEPITLPPSLGHTPEVFTYVVLTLVAMVMMLSFFILACLPSVRNLHTFAHMNLLVALSLTSVTFVVGINRVEIPGVCAALGVCLMFFLLSCLSWLVAESLVIARFLLTPPPHRNFLVYLIIVGWLFPVFLCGIPLGTVGIVTDSFIADMGYPNHCWLSLRVIYAFIAPVVILLLLYIIAIIFSLVMLSKTKKGRELTGVARATDKHRIRVALLISMVTMFFVVTTWTLGLLAVYVEKFIEYPFAILHAATAVFLFLVLCCNSQVREAVRAKLSRQSLDGVSLEATINTSRTASTIENNRRLTGTYAEVELIARPHHTSHHHYPTRHVTPYVTTVAHNRFDPSSSTTITSPTSTHTPVTTGQESSSPQQKEDEWFKLPDPTPLSPLTFSTEQEDESHDSSEPVYSHLRKSCDEGSVSTDIDHVPSPRSTEGRGSGGGSPQSYLEAEPMYSLPLQSVRSEDPLWYRQRDSTSVEVDPLPYETAVQSPVRSHHTDSGSLQATKLRSLSTDWLSHGRVSNHSSNTSSPATKRPPHLLTRPLPNPFDQSGLENSVTMPTKSTTSPHKHKEVRFKPSSPRKPSAGRTQSLNPPHTHPRARHRLSDLGTPPSSQLSSTIPSSLQVQVGHVTGSEQYHRDGPSSVREGDNEVIRHADGSETVRSLV